MIQPARVLPSNAPPLHETDGGHASRVLQEHSGNRQQSDYSSVHNYDQKYPAALLTENSYADHQQPHQSAHVYRQTPIQRHNYRYGRNQFGNDDQAKAEKLAKHLFDRFTQSEHYMKYRNKQPKGDKGPADKCWPDRMESAFFQALVRWPPMGRRKLHHKDKLRGRNELIADHILEITGEVRNRKQVSSHIQVLKPFVENDPFIMKWLSKEDMCAHSGHPGRWYGGSAHGSGRIRSNYPVTAPPHNLRNTASLISQSDVHALSKVKGMLEVFEPTDFQMFVQRKYGEDSVDRLHTYTGSITRPRQNDEQIPDWPTFAQSFPLLAAMHEQRPLDCNILVANASLAFPTETWKDKDGVGLPGVELGISFLCSSRHLPPNSQVKCQNSFFKDGKCLNSSHSTVPLTLSEDGTTVETQVKFGSGFWAKTLSYLAGRLRETGDPTKDPREDVDAHIRDITASQEIMLTTENGHERLLVIYWKFRLSTGSRGRAYWAKVHLPSASSGVDYIEQPKERSDSVYGYDMQHGDAAFSQHAHHQHQIHTQPALQSPFEYDSSSGSAPTSATWPPSMDDITNTAPASAVDFPADNSFDFSSGSIHLSYDPTFDLSTFDSSAFDFAATADFAADPALQDYSTQDYSTQWCDNYPTYDTQQPLEPAGPSYPISTAVDSQSQLAYETQQSIDSTGSAYTMTSVDSKSQNVFDSFGTQYDQSYHTSHDGQAYGGAGQEIMKEDDPLAALADASYMARGMMQHQGEHHTQ